MSATEEQVRWFRGADTDLVVAIWVTRTGTRQFHSGLYHRDYCLPKVLHFAGDRDLCEDTPEKLGISKGHGLIALSLDEDDAQTLCALCRRVATRHAQNLRYRFKEWQPKFDATTGDLTPPPPDEGHGFTCATFVLAMLRSAVVEELLSLDQWPVPSARDLDYRWQDRVAQILCSAESSPEHMAKIRAGIGARRVLPTDVAGGAMHGREKWPVGYEDARREGETIAASMQ